MALGPLARRVIASGVLVAAAACGTRGPRPLAFGTDPCAHCHMTLIDPRFAAELVTKTGRSVPFDDVGCLAAYVTGSSVSRDRIGSLWVGDFAHPGSMLEAGHAVFLRSDSLHTPMDYHVVALQPGATADSLRAALGGSLLSWEDVVRLVAERSGQ